MIKTWKTKFGEITSIISEHYHHQGVEVIRFDTEGRDHRHKTWEHAICLQGPSVIVVAGSEHIARPNQLFSVAPNTLHRMKPTTRDGATWLIWYSLGPPVPAVLHEIFGDYEVSG